MKSLKFLLLATAIGIAACFTTKAQDAAATDILGPMNYLDDIQQSRETLKNLDSLLKLSVELAVKTQMNYDRLYDPYDKKPMTAEAQEALKASLAAAADYQKLQAWRDHVNNRIAYDNIQLKGLGVLKPKTEKELEREREADRASEEKKAELADKGLWKDPSGDNGREAVRDAAKDALRTARDSAEAARQTGSDARGTMKCPDGH